MTSVAVIIPCFEQGSFLAEAVACALHQGPLVREIVVVDDGSTDDATRIVLDRLHQAASRLPVSLKIFRNQSNLGLAAARNVGIRQAQSEIILPLDADDLIADSYVPQVLGLVQDVSKPFIAYSRARFFGLAEGPWVLPPFSMEAMRQDNCIYASALFRRADWLACGGYSEDMTFLEDYDFWLKVLALGARVYRHDEELFFYRRHEANMTVRVDEERRRQALAAIQNRHKGFFTGLCVAGQGSAADAVRPPP
jgi:glycosyltransferase involved in cell wall biosynthesis